MRPFEHYLEAERLLEQINDAKMDIPSEMPYNDVMSTYAGLSLLAVEAQAHAMLANVGTKISAGDGSI